MDLFTEANEQCNEIIMSVRYEGPGKEEGNAMAPHYDAPLVILHHEEAVGGRTFAASFKSFITSATIVARSVFAAFESVTLCIEVK